MFFLVTKVFLEKEGEYGDKKIFLGLNPVSSEEIGFVKAKNKRVAAKKLGLKKLILKRQFSGYFLPKNRHKEGIEVLKKPAEGPLHKPPVLFAYDLSKLSELSEQTEPLS